MKIYDRVVIDMETLEVIEEDSFEYEGPVALCGGGGGSSGAVDYPDYMKDFHGQILNYYGFHELYGNTSVIQAINNTMNVAQTGGVAFSNTPYNATSPYDPDTRINNMTNAASLYSAHILLSTPGAWYSDQYIIDLINAFSGMIDDEINDVITPRFTAGMRNINAVQSYAFTMGLSNIEAKKIKAMAEFSAQMYSNHNNNLKENTFNIRQHFGEMTRLTIEANRLGIIAKSEYNSKVTDYSAKHRMWNLELFKFADNSLAAIGSASVHSGTRDVSPAQSALGGALAGAAVGAQVGEVGGLPGWAIGAAVGGIAGLLS